MAACNVHVMQSSGDLHLIAVKFKVQNFAYFLMLNVTTRLVSKLSTGIRSVELLITEYIKLNQ